MKDADLVRRIAEADRTLKECIAKSEETMLKSAAQTIQRKKSRDQRVSDVPDMRVDPVDSLG